MSNSSSKQNAFTSMFNNLILAAVNLVFLYALSIVFFKYIDNASHFIVVIVGILALKYLYCFLSKISSAITSFKEYRAN